MASNSRKNCKTYRPLAFKQQQDKRKRKITPNQRVPSKNMRADNDTHSNPPHCEPSEGTSVRSRKRKAEAAEESPKKSQPSKKMRAEPKTSRRKTRSDSSQCGTSEGTSVRGSKNPPRKKNRVRFCFSTTSSLPSDEQELYDVSFPIKTRKAEFEKQYKKCSIIKSGCFGSVYSGYRRADNMPVAIKCIPKEQVFYKRVIQNGKVYKIIEEVSLMVKAAGGAQSSAVIALLDCFDLKKEVIMVMEKPDPCEDLASYCSKKGGCLLEEEAKIILRQMVDATIEMHTNGVFHQDIKKDNILIETGSDAPRVRVIDFGRSDLMKQGPYDIYIGSTSFSPPECWSRNLRADSTTVWQLGALLYELLHPISFDLQTYLYGCLRVSGSLSQDSLNFLQWCLAPEREMRATLEELRLHSWLR